MNALVPYLIVFVVLAVTLALFARLAVFVRRRGAAAGAAAGALMGEEAFRATARQARVEIHAEAERRTPAPSPDDPYRVRFRGCAG